MNTVSLIGALTKDPQLRTLPGSEKPVLDLRLAVRRQRAVNGVKADYFSVTLFGRQAEVVAEYCTKGSRIGITGRLQHEEWGEDEQRRSRVRIIAESADILDWPARQDPEIDPDHADPIAA